MKETSEFLLMKVLQVKHSDNDIMEQLSEAELDALKTRNTCARLPEWLIAELETACTVMGISKTKFIHNAVVDYLDAYDKLVDTYEVFGGSDE